MRSSKKTSSFVHKSRKIRSTCNQKVVNDKKEEDKGWTDLRIAI